MTYHDGASQEALTLVVGLDRDMTLLSLEGSQPLYKFQKNCHTVKESFAPGCLRTVTTRKLFHASKLHTLHVTSLIC